MRAELYLFSYYYSYKLIYFVYLFSSLHIYKSNTAVPVITGISCNLHADSLCELQSYLVFRDCNPGLRIFNPGIRDCRIPNLGIPSGLSLYS